MTELFYWDPSIILFTLIYIYIYLCKICNPLIMVIPLKEFFMELSNSEKSLLPKFNSIFLYSLQ